MNLPMMPTDTAERFRAQLPSFRWSPTPGLQSRILRTYDGFGPPMYSEKPARVRIVGWAETIAGEPSRFVACWLEDRPPEPGDSGRYFPDDLAKEMFRTAEASARRALLVRAAVPREGVLICPGTDAHVTEANEAAKRGSLFRDLQEPIVRYRVANVSSAGPRLTIATMLHPHEPGGLAIVAVMSPAEASFEGRVPIWFELERDQALAALGIVEARAASGMVGHGAG